MMIGVVVEEQVQFTLVELSRACQADTRQLIELVAEGVLAPVGSGESNWRFDGHALRRTRAVMRLARELDMNSADAALVWQLLEEIASLKERLHRHECGAALAR